MVWDEGARTVTLNEMIVDLQHLIDKGHGNKEVEIYCKNCDCNDNYNGATGDTYKIQITIN